MLLRRLLGRVLRRRRRAQGRTLRDVAEAARVSVPYLSEVERGVKEPSSEVLGAIGAALGLTLEELLRDAVLDLRSLRSGAGRDLVVVPGSLAPPPGVSRPAAAPPAGTAPDGPTPVAHLDRPAEVERSRGEADARGDRPVADLAVVAGGDVVPLPGRDWAASEGRTGRPARPATAPPTRAA